MNKNANRNLFISIHASPQKWLLVLLPHFVSFIVVFSLVHVSVLLSIVATLAIIYSAFYFLRLHVWLSANGAVSSIYQDSKNNWFLMTAENEEKSVDLLKESFNSNMLIILNVVDNNKKNFTAVVTPDSVPKDVFRQLKVSLRMQ